MHSIRPAGAGAAVRPWNKQQQQAMQAEGHTLCCVIVTGFG
jgi:hypothetical protein